MLAAPGRPGANDRIGIGGIGVGRQGSGMLKHRRRVKDGRIVAVADVNLPRAQELGAKLKAEPTRTTASSWTARTWTPCSPPRPTTGTP